MAATILFCRSGILWRQPNLAPFLEMLRAGTTPVKLGDLRNIPMIRVRFRVRPLAILLLTVSQPLRQCAGMRRISQHKGEYQMSVKDRSMKERCYLLWKTLVSTQVI